MAHDLDQASDYRKQVQRNWAGGEIGVVTDALKSYPIKGGETGRARLLVLVGALAPTTEQFSSASGGLPASRRSIAPGRCKARRDAHLRGDCRRAQGRGARKCGRYCLDRPGIRGFHSAPGFDCVDAAHLLGLGQKAVELSCFTGGASLWLGRVSRSSILGSARANFSQSVA